MKADELLRQMRRHRTHQAIVIDEYGGTAGLVTFERVMERIVGELGGDFGTGASAPIRQLSDGSAEVDGLALVTDINERFGLDIDEETYTTLGGYMLGRLGRRPQVGDTIEVGGKTLRVQAVDGLRVSADNLMTVDEKRHQTIFLMPQQPHPLRSRRDAPMSATTAIHSVAEPTTASAERSLTRARADVRECCAAWHGRGESRTGS
jgi:hypothetical protein